MICTAFTTCSDSVNSLQDFPFTSDSYSAAKDTYMLLSESRRFITMYTQARHYALFLQSPQHLQLGIHDHPHTRPRRKIWRNVVLNVWVIICEDLDNQAKGEKYSSEFRPFVTKIAIKGRTMTQFCHLDDQYCPYVSIPITALVFTFNPLSSKIHIDRYIESTECYMAVK